jgi:hypothetical protein
MKRVPAEYYKAVDAIADIWVAEKKYVLGDRRSNQVLIDSEKNAWAFDYQFVGNFKRWESTKDSYANTLKQIPVLYERFMKRVNEKDNVSKNILKGLIQKINFGRDGDTKNDFQENPVLFGLMIRNDVLKDKIIKLFSVSNTALLTKKGFEEIGYNYDFNSSSTLLRTFVKNNENGGGGIVTLEDERGVVFHVFGKKNL